MKRYLIKTSLLSIILFSCSNGERKKENDIEVMKQSVITFANDLAFKNNGKVTIYTIQVIKVDTVSKRNVDSSYINIDATNKTDSYSNLCQISQSKAKQSISLIELSQLAGNSSSIQKYKDELKTNTKEAEIYLDSMKLTLKLSDSLLKLVSKNTDTEKMYRMKTFVKATFYFDKDSTNTMDTIYYSFNKNLKLYTRDNCDYKIKF